MSTTLGGRYQLVRELGAGGMGRVYQAIDTETGRAVAVKILLAGEDNIDALLRFQQEGALLSTLKHPNIVEVYGALLDAEQHMSCIIMELLEGRSLGRILRSERLSLERVRYLAGQVVSALAYAHGRGIIHRDIKPDNIMVVGNDHVKVTDFGIARILRTGATLNTATGVTIGTPLYMSPEQIEGQRVDGRADIYATGAVLYQMVTGRPPFEGDDPLTVAFKHVHKSPEAPSHFAADIPAEWEAVILKALAKDPTDRYQTATALEEAIADLPVDGSRINRAETALDEQPASPEVSGPAPGVGAQVPANLPLTRVDSSPPQSDTALLKSEPAAMSAAGSSAQPQADTQGRAVPADDSDRAVARSGRPPYWLFAAGGALLLLVVVAVALVALRGNGTSASNVSPTSVPGAAGLHRVNQWGAAGSGAGQFQSPAGVAVDGQGNVLVADTGNNRIQELAPSTDPVASWGTRGAEVGQFDHPAALALDRRGDIYVADTNNNRIQKFSSSGKLIGSWGSQGSGPGEFDHPSGVALDGDGNIYVADTGNNRVQKLSPSGSPLADWGSEGNEPGQFEHPAGIAVDDRGDVYVADTGNNRIQQLASTSDFLAQWGKKGTGPGSFAGPRSVAVDSQGAIYVADTGNDRVQKLRRAGRFVLMSAPGQLRSPGSVVLDGKGHLYVADTGNNRIQEFSVSP